MQTSRGATLLFILGALSLIFTIWLSWVGYKGFIDEEFYVRGALGWLSAPPHIGTTHWELRHPFVLSMAASFAVFGVHEASYVGVSLFYYIGVAIISMIALARCNGPAAAGTALLVLSLTPFFPGWATTTYPVMAELFFVAASIWCFWFATEGAGRHTAALYLAAGVLAGMAWLTRETGLALIGFYGLLFVFGYGRTRRRQLALFAGFAIVVILELGTYSMLTGDPLYRIRVDMNHGQTTSSGGAVTAVPSSPAPTVTPDKDSHTVVDRLLKYFNPARISGQKPTNVIDVNPWLNPYVSLFSDPYYGALFPFALLALIWLLVARDVRPEHRRLALLLAALGAVWMLFALYGLFLRPKPRYFSVTVYASAMILVTWLGHIWTTRKARWLIVLVALTVPAHLLLMEARQGLGQPAIRALLEYLDTTDEVVHLDPYTLARAEFWLRSAGKLQRVSVYPPAGDQALYFFNSGARDAYAEDRWPEFRPRTGWSEVWRQEPGKKWLGYVLDWSGLRGLMPEYLYNRLATPGPVVKVYRTVKSG